MYLLLTTIDLGLTANQTSACVPRKKPHSKQQSKTYPLRGKLKLQQLGEEKPKVKKVKSSALDSS